MKQILISVPRNRLYSEVASTTAYLGVKQAPGDDSGSHFDRLAVIDADEALLSRFTAEAVSALVERLKGLVADINLSSSAVALTLSLSESYDDCLTVSVTGNFEAYMAASVTARWLRIVQPDQEAVWQTESQRLLNEIISALYHRNPPRRHK